MPAFDAFTNPLTESRKRDRAATRSAQRDRRHLANHCFRAVSVDASGSCASHQVILVLHGHPVSAPRTMIDRRAKNDGGDGNPDHLRHCWYNADADVKKRLKIRKNQPKGGR
jgi:hypothetical protein